MKRLLQYLPLSLAVLFQFNAFAETPNDTLAKIKQSGAITLGVRESSPPFSVIEPGRTEAKGYSIDLCTKVVNAVRTELKMPKLEVKQVVITPVTRIPKLLDGSIDLECGSTTITRSRLEQVAFSYTTFMTGTRFLVKKSSKIESLADLKGKVVVLTKGTNNEKVVSKSNYEMGLGFETSTVKDHAEAFTLVQSGKAAAFAMDDILLAGLISKSGQPDEFEVIGKYLSIDPYALMFRKNDVQFETIVNKTLMEVFHSGEIGKLYNGWFLTKEMSFAMTGMTREALNTPTREPAWP